MTPSQNLTVEEIAALLTNFGEVRDWMDSVEAYALAHLQAGGVIPGYTLGLTRSTRVWVDEASVMQKLLEEGYSSDLITPRSLLSVAQMEKALGKAATAALLADSIGYKQGSPKVVPAKP